MINAQLRPVDQQRAGRLLLAWLRGDKLALDIVLDETARDPQGTAALVFAMTKIAAELALALDPHGSEQQVQAALLRLASDHLDAGGGDDAA